MIFAVPALPPATTPEVELTFAVPDALLVHTPPDGVLFNVVVSPTHTVFVPVIALGLAVTVNVCVEKHPPVSV